jgi:hypothetical protein
MTRPKTSKLLKKISEARRAKFDELRRTLQYVEASRASATKHMSLFHSLLNPFAHTSLRALNRRAIPFESAFDLSRQRWFARGHELHELFFARK